MSTKTNYVQLPRTINQEALDLLKSEAREKIMFGSYIATRSGGYYTHPGAAECQSFADPESFLTYIDKQALAGIQRYPNVSVYLQPGLYQVTYYKQADELDVLVKAAEQEAESAYTTEIESFNQAQTDLLTNQLVEAELRKEQKKADDHLASIRAKATAVAVAHIAQQLKEVV